MESHGTQLFSIYCKYFYKKKNHAYNIFIAQIPSQQFIVHVYAMLLLIIFQWKSW
jgi:hypothetical protein